MKQYFAKYLPVEGEIKEGDTVIHKITNDIGTVTKVSDEGKYQDEEVTKVKLFLCSKDIQIGDDFTQIGIDILHPTARFTCVDIDKEGDFVDDEAHHYAKATVYKVIGEISPDTVWVTEGMEFDEDELLKTIIYKYREPENNIPLSAEPLEGCIVKDTFIKIKCPTCKTYH